MIVDYVHRQNIERFEKLLLSETDPRKRLTIEQLLKAERAKDQIQGPAVRPET
jgi:hypothetical protein